MSCDQRGKIRGRYGEGCNDGGGLLVADSTQTWNQPFPCQLFRNRVQHPRSRSNRVIFLNVPWWLTWALRVHTLHSSSLFLCLRLTLPSCKIKWKVFIKHFLTITYHKANKVTYSKEAAKAKSSSVRLSSGSWGLRARLSAWLATLLGSKQFSESGLCKSTGIPK